MPIDADFDPPVEDAELERLFGGDYVQVWRPGAGLVAAEAGDVLRAADLVAPWPRCGAAVGSAVPGVALAERLTVGDADCGHELRVDPVGRAAGTSVPTRR